MALLRKYELKSRTPVAQVKAVIEAEFSRIIEATPDSPDRELNFEDRCRKLLRRAEWRQITAHSYAESAALTNWIKKEFGGEPTNLLVHILNSSVDSHTDDISTGVRLIPIQVPKSVEFVISNWQEERKPLRKGYMYKFNDSHRHGLSNPHNALTILVTFDGIE